MAQEKANEKDKSEKINEEMRLLYQISVSDTLCVNIAETPSCDKLE